MGALLISLGGARYPFAPKLQHAAFKPSSTSIGNLLSKHGLCLVEDGDHLDLFDREESWPDQLMLIKNWLKQRESALPTKALIVHYVGHGFLRPRSEQYFLTINRTDADHRVETSANLASLTDVLRRCVPDLQTYYLIDACFAASVIRDLQASGVDDAILAKLNNALEESANDKLAGVAALCSSSSAESSSAAGLGGLTQFTDGLVSILQNGDPDSTSEISLQRLALLLRRSLIDRYGQDAIPPVLHAPQGKRGGIGDIGLFPNLKVQDVDRMYEDLSSEIREDLSKRASKFVDELFSETDTVGLRSRYEAVGNLGSHEIRSLLNIENSYNTYRFENMQEFHQNVRKLRMFLPRNNNIFVKWYPGFELKRFKSSNILTVIECIASQVGHWKDQFLRENAHIGTDIEKAILVRSRIVRMLFICSEVIKYTSDGRRIDIKGFNEITAEMIVKKASNRRGELSGYLSKMDADIRQYYGYKDLNIIGIKQIDDFVFAIKKVAQNIKRSLGSLVPNTNKYKRDELIKLHHDISVIIDVCEELRKVTTYR